MFKRGKWLFLLVLGAFLGWSLSASAFQVELHGQFGTKNQTTNTLGMIDKGGKTNIPKVLHEGQRPAEGQHVLAPVDEIGKDDLDDTWGELQFRLWSVVSSDDGNVKGVWSMEVGTLRYGEKDEAGSLTFKNEGKDIEVREMYLDVQIPWIQSENRLIFGLQEVDINEWVLSEIGAGIRNYGSFTVGKTIVDYQIGWLREDDSINYRWDGSPYTNDSDFWYGKIDFELKEHFGVDKFQVGIFGIYNNDCTESADDRFKGQPYWVGLELDFQGFKGIIFDLDGIYLGGDADEVNGEARDDYDAWFLHATLGYQWTNQLKTSFTFWYASGDDNGEGDDYEAYRTVMTDTYGSVVLFEDATFDDGWYVSDNPYLDNDLGFIMYRFRVDYQATPKLALAAAVNYMQFDEDVEYVDPAGHKSSDDAIGWEVDLYLTYEIYKGLTSNIAFGYLFTDDGMDTYAKYVGEGDADDMYRFSFGLTYSFQMLLWMRKEAA